MNLKLCNIYLLFRNYGLVMLTPTMSEKWRLADDHLKYFEKCP